MEQASKIDCNRPGRTGGAPRRVWSRSTALPIASIWIFILALGLGLVVKLQLVRESLVARTQDSALSLAKLVATHAQSQFDAVNLLLMNIADSLRLEDMTEAEPMSAARRERLLTLFREQMRRMPKLVSIYLMNERGQVLVHTQDNLQKIDASDRPYFQELRDGNMTTAISESLKGRGSGRWGMQVARAIRHPDGRLAGVISANLGTEEAFANYLRNFRIGQYSLLGLRDKNNRILLRYPMIEEAFGKAVGNSPSNEAIRRDVEETTLTSTSPVDGQTRIVGLRKLEGYPIYATGGIALDYALQDYYRERNWVIAFMLLAFCGGVLQTLMLLRRSEMQQQLTSANEELVRLLTASEISATHDELTGLLNRRAFERRLAEAIARVERGGPLFSLLILELEPCKPGDDHLGLQGGDDVARDVASLLSSRLRTSDALACWGGKEFLFIAEGSDEARAQAFADDLRKLVASHRFPDGNSMTLSVGVTGYRSGDRAEDMMKRGGEALHSARISGGDRGAN